MFGENAGDVVVDDNHVVDFAEPLLGKHADGGRAATNAHALFADSIDDRRLAGLHDDGGAFVDREFDGLAVAEIEQRLTGDCTLVSAAAGKMADAAKGKHLRPVFRGGDVANRFALGAHRVLLWSEKSIGIDLKLDATIAEDALGHDGDHVDAFDFGRNNERRGFVVGIGGAGTDRCDEGFLSGDEVAVPFAIALEEGNDGFTARHGAIKDHVRFDPDQFAILIAVAIARAETPGLDVAENRAGIAANSIVVSHETGLREMRGWLHECGRAWRARGACGRRSRRRWHSESQALWG